MSQATATSEKPSSQCFELGYQIFLEFQEVKENLLIYLENYQELNNILSAIFEKLNIRVENHIKKLFFNEEESNQNETQKVEKIKIIYLLSNGHFNILTNRKNRTITIEYFLKFMDKSEKHDLHQTCKSLENALCYCFGWENCLLNLSFKRGSNSSLKLAETKSSKTNILKNVKLILKKNINDSDYRVYQTLLLDKILIKNEQLLYASKLSTIIKNYLDDVKKGNDDKINWENEKFLQFTEYFPKLNLLLFNYKNVFNILKKIKNAEGNILISGGDYIFAFLLMLMINKEKHSKESSINNKIKIFLVENDIEKLEILKENFQEFDNFINELKTDCLLEVFDENSSLLKEKSFDLLINLEEEKSLEEILNEYHGSLTQFSPLITFAKEFEKEKSEKLLRISGFEKFEFINYSELDDLVEDSTIIAYKN